MQQLFSIDYIEADNPSQIEKSKRFDKDIERKDQIFAIEGLSWEDVNVVK